jgi:quercetin dioxygenase-like cupin family protein
MIHHPKTFLTLAVALGLGASVIGWRQEDAKPRTDHTIITPEDVKWGDAPASIPPGARGALLDGDPSKPGVFVLRLKLPAGYKIPPHWHPVDERVTIVSGKLNLGLGDNFDAAKTRPLGPGSFYSLPPKTTHFSVAAEETVMQISTVGPWSLTYVHPEDDPRKAKSK